MQNLSYLLTSTCYCIQNSNCIPWTDDVNELFMFCKQNEAWELTDVIEICMRAYWCYQDVYGFGKWTRVEASALHTEMSSLVKQSYQMHETVMAQMSEERHKMSLECIIKVSADVRQMSQNTRISDNCSLLLTIIGIISCPYWWLNNMPLCVTVRFATLVHMHTSLSYLRHNACHDCWSLFVNILNNLLLVKQKQPTPPPSPPQIKLSSFECMSHQFTYYIGNI